MWESLHGLWFSIQIASDVAGLPILFFQVAFARALMMAHPELTTSYHRPGPSIPDITNIPTSGKRIFSLYFKHDVMDVIRQIVPDLPLQPGWTPDQGPLARQHVLAHHALPEMDGTPEWLYEQSDDFHNQMKRLGIRYQQKKMSESGTPISEFVGIAFSIFFRHRGFPIF